MVLGPRALLELANTGCKPSLPACRSPTAPLHHLQNTFVRKVKLLRAPKFDINKLMEVHGDYTAEAAAAAAAASEKLERPAEEIVGMAPEEATA